MSERETPSTLGRLARLAIVTTGLWILLGASFKLLWGTPADLPQVVRDVPLELGLTYRLAIAVELVLVALAFLKPRWAWLPLMGTLILFDLILQRQIDAGAATCGCFGSKLQMSPWIMLAIDSALFLGILFTRPWASLRGKGAPALLVLAVAAVGAALPWLLDREVRRPATAGQATGSSGGETTINDEIVLPNSWVQLDLRKWVGKDLGQTELGRRMDVYSMPPDALWVLYRTTCDHCAAHLAKLAEEEIGQRFLVLCRLKDKNDSDQNRLVHRMPEGDFVFHCELPDTVEYVVTTPAEMEVEAFVVTRAEEGVGAEEY